MSGFLPEYLANLTADLTVRVLNALGRRLKTALSGSEEDQALQRCVEAGIVALVATASSQQPDDTERLEEIFRHFAADPDVGRAVADILRGHIPDPEDFIFLLKEAGYDPASLPELDPRVGYSAFATALLEAAAGEPALQEPLKTRLLLAQTGLQREQLTTQREQLTTQREMVALLRQGRPGTARISEDGQIVVQLPSGELQALPLPQLQLPPPDTGWESFYLRTLVNHCDPLDITPIDPAHPLDADPVRISDVFTTLYLKGLTRAPEQAVAEAIRKPHGGEPMARRDQEKEEERLPIQAVEGVAALPKLVILGEPGGGKSTLVNHLATQLARRRLGHEVGAERLPGWSPDEAPFPLRIVLRRFAAWLPDQKRGTAGLVWAYLEHQARERGCEDACDRLKSMLRKQGGIVFFDGLDEVHESDEAQKRSLIVEAIARFAAPLEKCRVVVTCREYAYQAGDAWRLPGALFPVVELELFNLDQVQAFTDTWYRVVGPTKGWSQTKCQREAANLCEAVRAGRHLLDLAQYPLLLTLMAQVHGRDGTLPQDRADLYRRVVDLLLTDWENRIVRDVDGVRQVQPGIVLQLGIKTETLRAALLLLLAHERQEKEQGSGERAADIPREDLRDALAAGLGGVGPADQAIAYIQQRAGLLLARDNRTYAFPHRSFQEYLAARYLLKQAEYEEMLRDRVRRDWAWWQEVFLLAAGASRDHPSVIRNLADTLLPFGPVGAVPEERAEEAHLAARALWETGFDARALKEEETEAGRFSATYRRIQRWLVAALRSDKTLDPSMRDAVGRTLNRLGDPRFRADAWFLPDEPLLGFAHIPAGPFLMGSDKEHDPQAYDAEQPQHTVTLPDYYIARYPVTVAQFRAFVDGAPFEPRDPDCLRDPANHPVRYVSWHEARAYCAWLTGVLVEWDGLRGELLSSLRDDDWCVRLPTEAEREKAARGPFLAEPGEGRRVKAPQAPRIYPWGDEFDPNRCNVEMKIGSPSSVGCYPGGASPYGIEDLSGNVYEWTSTLWSKAGDGPVFEYPYDAADGRENLEAADEVRRVLRGGAFNYSQRYARCAYRSWDFPRPRYDDLGGRVVVAPVASGR